MIYYRLISQKKILWMNYTIQHFCFVCEKNKQNEKCLKFNKNWNKELCYKNNNLNFFLLVFSIFSQAKPHLVVSHSNWKIYSIWQLERFEFELARIFYLRNKWVRRTSTGDADGGSIGDKFEFSDIDTEQGQEIHRGIVKHIQNEGTQFTKIRLKANKLIFLL